MTNVGPGFGRRRLISTTIDIHEATADLAKLLDRVSVGEEIVIAEVRRPVARLVAIKEETAQRLPGSAKGQVILAPDFDAPWPEELARAAEAWERCRPLAVFLWFAGGTRLCQGCASGISCRLCVRATERKARKEKNQCGAHVLTHVYWP